MRCIVASGGAGARCVQKYDQALVSCRIAADAGCETALRTPGGPLATLLAATEQPVRAGCTPAAADVLTSSLGLANAGTLDVSGLVSLAIQPNASNDYALSGPALRRDKQVSKATTPQSPLSAERNVASFLPLTFVLADRAGHRDEIPPSQLWTPKIGSSVASLSRLRLVSDRTCGRLGAELQGS